MENLQFLRNVGNTPLIQINPKSVGIKKNINLYCKHEGFNPTGSIKDRAASQIFKIIKELNLGNPNTKIIESSSGNFGVALAAYSKLNNYDFTCVIDPLISPLNELLLKAFDANLIKVKESEKGGFLLNRLKTVHEFTQLNPNSYWINQYENPHIANAYQSLSDELISDLKTIDYLFIGVSSGGTITGVSNSIKRQNPNIKIIAVDMEGSVIFGNHPKPRVIPGIGSSKVPPIIKNAKIDDVVIVDVSETIIICHKLLQNECIMVGGSSGSVIAAIEKYFSNIDGNNKNVIAILHDKGEKYIDSIYNVDWLKTHNQINKKEKTIYALS